MITQHIKIATKEDIPRIIELAKHFHKHSPYGLLRTSNNKMREYLNGIIASDKMNAIVLLSLKDEVITGMIICAANEPPFSEDKIATEMAWWVEPEYRGSKGAFLLFSAYEDWALRVGCKYIHCALLTDHSSPKLHEIYKKRGYKMIESSYTKGLL